MLSETSRSPSKNTSLKKMVCAVPWRICKLTENDYPTENQLKTFVLSSSAVQPSEYDKLEKASAVGDLTGVHIECLPVPDALKYTMPEGVGP
jgi:hypothetical protein